MKEVARKHIEAIGIYSPYKTFLVYFVPVFSVILIGYYIGEGVSQNFIAMSRDFHVISKILIALIVLTAVGKVLSELAHLIVSGFSLIIYSLGLLIYKATKWVRHRELITRLRKWLHSVLAEQAPHLNSVELDMYLKNNLHIKAWYEKTYVTTTAFQTTLGAVIMLYFLGNGEPLLLFIIFVFLIVAYVSRKNLTNAERILEKKI